MGLVTTRRLAAMRKQQRAKAGMGVLPVPMLPIPNWGLKLDIGNMGNISTKWVRLRWAGR